MKIRELEMLVRMQLSSRNFFTDEKANSKKSFFRIIPCLYFQQDNFKQNGIMSKAILCKDQLLSMLDEIQMETSISKRTFIDNMPFPFNNIDNHDNNFNLEKSLSRVISQLHKYLLTSTSKYFMVIFIYK